MFLNFATIFVNFADRVQNRKPVDPTPNRSVVDSSSSDNRVCSQHALRQICPHFVARRFQCKVDPWRYPSIRQKGSTYDSRERGLGKNGGATVDLRKTRKSPWITSRKFYVQGPPNVPFEVSAIALAAHIPVWIEECLMDLLRSSISRPCLRQKLVEMK